MGTLRKYIERVSEKELLRLLRSFTEATGMGVMIVDCDGRALLKVDREKDCRFCRIIQSDPVGFNKCCGSYARAAKEAAKFGESYIFRCHAGLVAFAAPLLFDGELSGALICGQVMMWEPEDFFWEEMSEMTAGLNVKISELMEAAREMDVVSGRRVQAAADMLFAVASQIMQAEAPILKKNKESALRQAYIFEEIKCRKQQGKGMKQVEAGEYPESSIQLERELRGKIRLRDRDGAYQVLNKMVSGAVEKFISQKELFKASMVEMAVVIGRAAVEAGSDHNEILELSWRYIEEIVQTDEVDAICSCIYRMMDEIMNRICAKPNNLAILEAAKRYIRENYHRCITLNDIARAVYISPYYLSHIFKEHLNCTVIDYLTSVRMEEAKKLLRRKGISIVSVAKRIGYSDSGYFSKVFKKCEGITPSDYKRQLML